MYLKLFVFSVLVCCVYGLTYELPDNEDTKSLNVTIILDHQFQITFNCYNLESLKFFEVRLGNLTEFKLRNGLVLDFIKCFNNATDHGNYNYGLNRWFNSLPYFNTTYPTGYPLTVQLDEYAELNTDAMFESFDFKKLHTVAFTNVGFSSSRFLNQLYCETCIFQNTGRIDFTEFHDNIRDANWLQITFTKLINFTPANLKKFVALATLKIINFELEDYNALNVPGLFEHNVHITEIKMQNSGGKITLHEQVFRGLTNMRILFLQELQLDNIPKGLFNDLTELSTVYLSSNNIKTVDPSIFETNKKFLFISFTDNPFYTEPHDKLETFDMGGKSTRLELGNFTEHTFDLFEQLVKYKNLSSLSFQSYLNDNFNFAGLTKIHSKRDKVLDISFSNAVPLDLAYIKSLGENIIRPQFDIKDKLDIQIRVEVSGDSMCHDCTMIKYLFPHYLSRYNDRPGFYFNESRLFVGIKVPAACSQFEVKFDKTFNENCPENCDCKFNPLTEKVKIYCNNKNLTEIPRIPYPQQYENLRSIDLHFENNSLSVLSRANQDDNVWKKISILNLKNNPLESLPTESSDNIFSNIWALNICGNPVVTNAGQHVQPTLASGTKNLYKNNCEVDDETQRVLDFIQEKKPGEIDEYLNALKCE